MAAADWNVWRDTGTAAAGAVPPEGPRGQFPFLETLGSRLWQLGQVSSGQRQAAAEQYVAEALAEEPGVQVERVTIADNGSGGVTLTAELTWEGESLSVTAEIL